MLHQKYRDRGLLILGISMDRDTSLVVPYLKQYGVTFPNLPDPGGEVYPMFSVRYTPTNFFVNRRGYVVGGSLGYRKWDASEGLRLIEALLDEKAPAM